MEDKKTLYIVSKISDIPYSEKLLSLLDVLAECIGDGHFERHINRIRRKRRREIKKKS